MHRKQPQQDENTTTSTTTMTNQISSSTPWINCPTPPCHKYPCRPRLPRHTRTTSQAASEIRHHDFTTQHLNIQTRPSPRAPPVSASSFLSSAHHLQPQFILRVRLSGRSPGDLVSPPRVFTGLLGDRHLA
ncbi:hypothetical protein E2C01_095849 [Portunus trituberculatus]|uniref:Uncharacterized protein n=1 Tax=Portunus trituberculatus TaxID=210409 RepID=A0A5B7JQX6_PORTR|nr:hypothetical protein [Portunus trituberculatus]